MSRANYNPSELSDLGSAIKKIAENTVNNMVTLPFLARVTVVTGNTVTVTPIDILTYNGIPIPTMPLTNVTVGMPYTGRAQVTYPIFVGDIGLCIVTNRDMANYKSTGMEGMPKTARRFSQMDSVFIPLSMQKQDSITLDYVFKYLGAPMVPSVELKISGQNAISIQGGPGGSIFKFDISNDGALSYSDVSQNKVSISSTGISVADISQNKVDLSAQGITITDVNQNKIELSAAGIKIQDVAGNKVELAASATTVQTASGAKMELGATGATLQDAAGNKFATSPAGVDVAAVSGAKINIGPAGVNINNGALMVLP